METTAVQYSYALLEAPLEGRSGRKPVAVRVSLQTSGRLDSTFYGTACDTARKEFQSQINSKCVNVMKFAVGALEGLIQSHIVITTILPLCGDWVVGIEGRRILIWDEFRNISQSELVMARKSSSPFFIRKSDMHSPSHYLLSYRNLFE